MKFDLIKVEEKDKNVIYNLMWLYTYELSFFENENKKLAISRLKKWNVEEYKEDRRKREEQSEQMVKNAFYNSKNSWK